MQFIMDFRRVMKNFKNHENIFTSMSNAASEYGQEGNYVVGSNIAGFLKVAHAMHAQGTV